MARGKHLDDHTAVYRRSCLCSHADVLPFTGNRPFGCASASCRLQAIVPLIACPYADVYRRSFCLCSNRPLRYIAKVGLRKRIRYRKSGRQLHAKLPAAWSKRRESNPREPAWEAGAIPLGDSCIGIQAYIIIQHLHCFGNQKCGEN